MHDYVILRVRLTPRGGRDTLVTYEGGVLGARVSAPPVDGAANKALLALLSEVLHVPKSQVSLLSGDKSRDKVLRIEGLTTEALEAKLQIAVQ